MIRSSIIAAVALLAGCTDFQFEADLTCSAGGNCPTGFFCDTSADVCRTDLASCANSVVDPGEVCDDGNRASGDGCRADCLKLEVCGDSEQDTGEGCDDGNMTAGDGCASDCSKIELCGDNVRDETEACDDGNTVGNDGCSVDCGRSEPTITYASPSTNADEASGTIVIPVRISSATDVEVRVAYAVTGGTASQGTDFTTTSGELVFGPGETQREISIAIAVDALEETPETIELTLSLPINAKLGAPNHIITIAANTLPRINFAAPTGGANEGSGSIQVTLDKASALPISVSFTLAGTASGADDYTLTAGTITFPAASTAPQVLVLGTIVDDLHEDDETVVLALQDPVNAFLGTTTITTHTIKSLDPAPNVAFVLASSKKAENVTPATPVLLEVRLSTRSGRTVTVPYSVGGSASNPADYTHTVTPLTFAAGETSRTIDLLVVDDADEDPDEETVVVTLEAATNATNTGIQTHTFSILDNERTCLGASPFDVCVPPPSSAVALPASINTDSSALCEPAQPMGWLAKNQPAVCVVAATSITTTAATRVLGSRPLILFATGSITISHAIDAAAHLGTSGPGAPSTSCGGFILPEPTGGAAGGAFMTMGGSGGVGGLSAPPGGSGPNLDTPPLVLRAGCEGQADFGQFGRAGGALYIVSAGTLTMSTNGALNVSGAGGFGGSPGRGGGGGGSGGMIKLDVAAFAATVGAKIIANGGGGGGGGSIKGSGGLGANGDDPALGSPTTGPDGGIAGTGCDGDGGKGFPAIAAMAGRGGGDSECGGGGGGGGGGLIQSNRQLTNTTTSAGTVQVP